MIASNTEIKCFKKNHVVPTYLCSNKYTIFPIFIPLCNFSAVLMAKKVQPNVKVGGLGTNCKKSKACLPFTKTGPTIITEIFSRYYKLQKGFRNCDFNLSNIFKIKKVFQFILSYPLTFMTVFLLSPCKCYILLAYRRFYFIFQAQKKMTGKMVDKYIQRK